MERDPDPKYNEDNQSLPFPLFSEPRCDQRFIIPKSRKVLPIPAVRKAIATFIGINSSLRTPNYPDSEENVSFVFEESVLDTYRAKAEEQIKLSPELLIRISEDPTIGKYMKITGGTARTECKHTHNKSRKRKAIRVKNKRT
jgi:hypothetical protein